MAFSRSDRRTACAAGLAAAALLAGAARAAAAPAPPGDTAQCFDLTRQRSLRALDDRTLLVRLGPAEFVRIDMAQSCPAIARPDPRITLRSHGGSFVCGRLDFDVLAGRGGDLASSVPCAVGGVRRLSPAEVAALPEMRRR
jgi:hypothetical protein